MDLGFRWISGLKDGDQPGGQDWRNGGDVDGAKTELNQVGTCLDLKKTKHLANTGTHGAATVVEQGSDGVKWKVQCSRF